jgi:hypothetical protein
MPEIAAERSVLANFIAVASLAEKSRRIRCARHP